MACVPMNIHAQEVVDSFEYTGQKIEIQNAMLYYTIEGELLDEAPIYCGTYIAWTSDEEAILFEINPKKVPIKVTYNKDWRENDPDKEKYLCDYVGNFEVLKTKVTHPDVEYVYSEDGTKIYSDIDQVEPIQLKDVGEYIVAFDLDERYYESVPFKVTILPKTIELKPNKQFKYFGEQDPILENDDYILTREPGEDIGDYKLTVNQRIISMKSLRIMYLLS